MLNKVLIEKLKISDKTESFFCKENIIYLFIFAIWFFVALMTGLHHESWNDEAQAWLIARETSFSDIIFSDILNYEGHPALWYFIVKIFIIMGLPYEYFFVIPLMFMSVGMFFFLFKSNFPYIVKVLFPFTFFVFYLYPVIARSHSLIFPFLALIAVLYPKRLERPFLYAISLILLLSISAHSYVIAGVLFLFFCYDIFKSFKETGINKSAIISVTITGFCFLGTVLYLLPFPVDLVRYSRIPADTIFLSFIEPSVSGFFDLKPHSFMTYIQFLCVLFLYTTAFFVLCKNKKQMAMFLSIPVILTLTMKYVHYVFWHSGYIFLSFIFIVWILHEENNITRPYNKLQKLFYTILCIMMLIQIPWSLKSITADSKGPFCASKAAAQFIKNNHLDNYEINGIGFKSTSIQPYFNKNVYSNFTNAYWAFTSGNYIINEKSKTAGVPVLIVEYSKEVFTRNEGKEFLNYLLDNYDVYEFDGNMFLFGRLAEKNILLVCLKKGIVPQISIQKNE